jgi:hypothetical protein
MYGGEHMLTHDSLLKLELNVQTHLKLGCGFVLTTWARRISAEALMLEQLFCYGLRARVTTNILDWRIHASNYAALEEFLDNQPLPPWKWTWFGGFKPQYLPVRPEELSPPTHALTQSENDVAASP